MMRKKILIMGLFILASLATFAQNGKLAGYILDKDKQPVPFATIKVMSGGQLKGGNQAELNGHYSVSPLTPGSYDVEVSCVGYQTKHVRGVVINLETTTSLNITLPTDAEILQVVDVVYERPLVDKDQTSGGAKLTAQDIAKMPTRSVNSLLSTQASVVSADDGGGISIRGNRSSDNIVFINGVRQYGGSNPPVESIEEISLITSGVPAQYGDALGGVINITTKGAAEKFSGSAFAESSRPFNKWNQEVGGVTLTGPLLKRKAKLDSTGAVTSNAGTLLGYFATLQYSHNRESNPSSVDYWKVKDSALDLMKKNPIFFSPEASNFRSVSDTFSLKQFEKVKYRPNSANGSVQFNSSFDFQPTENSVLTIGGNFNYSNSRNASDLYYNVFNYDNNDKRTTYDYNAFIRFRQTFKHIGGTDPKSALIKNIFYQVQADYSNVTTITQDAKLKDNFFQYNYYGKFKDKKSASDFDTTTTNGWALASNFGDTLILIHADSSRESIALAGKKYYVKGSSILQGFVSDTDPLSSGFTFTPEGSNTIGGRYNTIIQDYMGGTMYNLGALSVLGGAMNGNGIYMGSMYESALNNIGGTDAIIANEGSADYTLGQQTTRYRKTNQEQYRASLQAGFDIKNHSIRIGGEFEQRVSSQFAMRGNLWQAARNQVNTHITNSLLVSSVGENSLKELADGSILVNGQNYANTDIQSTFDKNLRAKLSQIRGTEVAANELINIDEIDPNLLSLDMFSASELFLNQTTPYTTYQGYDIFGNRKRGSKGNAAFYNFFTDPSYQDAFRPNYLAGYIQDKFEINDLIVNVGLRVDRFDVNQPVLKDKYSFTDLTLVGETDFSQFKTDSPAKPSNVGDDWAVYVNSNPDGIEQNKLTVIGYRSGSTWYNANGAEDNTIQQQIIAGSAYPYFSTTGLSDAAKSLQQTRGITTSAFKDFKPQVNFMPRVAFSFPVSEQTNFFAHYDILTQRPTPEYNYGTALQYYSLKQTSGVQTLANPDLLPQKKIDYQVGFDQQLSDRSALKLTASYSEIKDLIQIINVIGAYPVAQYRTYGNQDFTTVKSLSLEYTLRRSENFQASASYTLQFAETSASDFAGRLLQTSTPTLRNVVASNSDQRHAIKLNLDYRINKGDATSAFGKIFEGLGVNATFYTGSGLPYTANSAQWGANTQIKGGINSSRLPWNNRTSLRIDRNIEFAQEGKKKKVLNVYLYIQNVFNAKNTLQVYDRTGSASDDGYLSSDYGQQTVASTLPSPEAYVMYYNMTLANPDFYIAPRRVRIGCSFSF